MTNTVIRHYGESRSDVPHPVLSSQCRTTMDEKKITCDECVGYLEAIEFGYIEAPVPIFHNPKFDLSPARLVGAGVDQAQLDQQILLYTHSLKEIFHA